MVRKRSASSCETIQPRQASSPQKQRSHEVGIPRVVDQQLFSDTDLSKSYDGSLRERATSGLGHDQLCIRPAAVIQKAKRRVGIEAEA